MVRRLAFALAMALSGCGVDGPPEVPREAARPGVTVTGDARMGVVFTP